MRPPNSGQSPLGFAETRPARLFTPIATDWSGRRDPDSWATLWGAPHVSRSPHPEPEPAMREDLEAGE